MPRTKKTTTTAAPSKSAKSSIGSPKGRVPRACTWVNVKGKYSFRFSNYFYPALGQAKLES
jgi:hypothetical protein